MYTLFTDSQGLREQLPLKQGLRLHSFMVKIDTDDFSENNFH